MAAPVGVLGSFRASPLPSDDLDYGRFAQTVDRKRAPSISAGATANRHAPASKSGGTSGSNQYPDVLIERVEITGEETEKKADGEAESMGTFEVVVDGKLVVRTNNQRVGNNGSIFVSMAEMDLAITRARKRRRPSTVYGEDGKFIRKIDAGDIQDETVKSRLEVLKQKAMELQSQSGDGKE